MHSIEYQITFTNGQKEKFLNYEIPSLRPFEYVSEHIAELIFDICSDVDYIGMFVDGDMYKQWYEGELGEDPDFDEDYD